VAAVPDHEPRSGGGKVTRFGLQDKAQALGAEVAMLEDMAALARKAVADGADQRRRG
jgi:hypothetical protein